MGLFSKKKKGELETAVPNRFGRLVGEEYFFADHDKKMAFVRSVAEGIATLVNGKVTQPGGAELQVAGKYLDRSVRLKLDVDNGTLRVDARPTRWQELNDQYIHFRLEYDEDGAGAAPAEPDEWQKSDDRKVFFSEHVCMEYEAADIDEKQRLFERLPAELRRELVEFIEARLGDFSFAFGEVDVTHGRQVLAYTLAAEEAELTVKMAARLAAAIDAAW